MCYDTCVMREIAYNDIILLVGPKGKRYVKKLLPTEPFHSSYGVIYPEKIIEAGFGNVVFSEKDIPFLVQRANIYDILYALRRKTQIIYPKDAGYIAMRLGVGRNTTIIEAGSGSGGLTVIFSHLTSGTGHVYTYEARQEFYELTKKNLAWACLGHNVTQYHHDIADGFFETGIDAIFLDVRTPWLYLDAMLKALVPGGRCAFLLPTITQVSTLLTHLETRPFADIEIEEIIIRKWKPIPDRLRPFDRMVAHTSFLLFARHQENIALWEKNTTKGTRERKQQLAKEERLLETAYSNTDTADTPYFAEEY